MGCLIWCCASGMVEVGLSCSTTPFQIFFFCGAELSLISDFERKHVL